MSLPLLWPVDAVLVVGPLECTPNKVAESQLVHAGEREALPSLTLSLDGNPIDSEPLDGFAVMVHDRVRAQGAFEPRRHEPSHVRAWSGAAALTRSSAEADRSWIDATPRRSGASSWRASRGGTCPGCTWWARR